MAANNHKRNSIIDKLDEIEMGLLSNNENYAKEFFLEEGFDPLSEKEYGNQFIKKIRFIAVGLANKNKDQNLLDIAFGKLKILIKENSSKASEALINLLHQKNPAFHYRKLENWSDDEIRDVLSDIDLIQLLEELKNEEK